MYMDMFPAAPGAGSVYINIHPEEVVVDVFSAADRPPPLVKHRVGFTGGLFWTGFGFRLFLFGFKLIAVGSKPVQIGSWGRKRSQETI
jgi:hypothetical protein